MDWSGASAAPGGPVVRHCTAALEGTSTTRCRFFFHIPCCFQGVEHELRWASGRCPGPAALGCCRRATRWACCLADDHCHQLSPAATCCPPPTGHPLLPGPSHCRAARRPRMRTRARGTRWRCVPHAAWGELRRGCPGVGGGMAHTSRLPAAPELRCAPAPPAQAFINAPRPEEVVFTRNATEGLNIVAHGWGLHNLGPGDQAGRPGGASCAMIARPRPGSTSTRTASSLPLLPQILMSVAEHHSSLAPFQLVAQKASAERCLLTSPHEGPPGQRLPPQRDQAWGCSGSAALSHTCSLACAAHPLIRRQTRLPSHHPQPRALVCAPLPPTADGGSHCGRGPDCRHRGDLAARPGGQAGQRARQGGVMTS